MLTLYSVAQDPSVLSAISDLERVVGEIRDIAIREKLDVASAVTLMHRIDQLTDSISEKVKSPLENIYNSLKFSIVPTVLEDAGLTNATIDGIGRVTVIDDVRTSVEDKQELMEWLREHEMEDMISEVVNANTLTAFVRKQLREGGEVPPPVKVTPFVRAQITKVK